MASQQPSADSLLTTVTVGEAMHPGVIACPREATLPTMAATLITHGIHAVVVSAQHAGPPLVVTDMEILRAAIEDGADGGAAADLAREPIATLPADAALAGAVEMMAARYVTHLLATDPATGAPSGILSSLDVAAVVGASEPRLARMQRPGPARPSASARRLEQAKVSDVMHPGVVTCAPDASLRVVGRTMADHRVHCVAVAGIDTTEGRGQHLTWGLIADIDFVRALHRGASGVRASTVAAAEPLAVNDGDSLDHAAALMVEHGARHLVVVNSTGQPAGIVSTLDIAIILAASG